MNGESLPLFLGVFLGFVTSTIAQVECFNPRAIGELRLLSNTGKCISIDGRFGLGSIVEKDCVGNDKQQVVFCEDGTMRNLDGPYYCWTVQKDGKVVSKQCPNASAIPDDLKWRFGKSRNVTDNAGLTQDAREIRNVKSRKCLDVDKLNGKIRTYKCGDLGSQYFFFRFRGKQVARGRLQVQKSNLCIDVTGDKGGQGLQKNNVILSPCANAVDQYFGWYENGEMINAKSRLCLEVEGGDGEGNILVYSCADAPDQKWSQPTQLCNGEYCSFRNKRSGLCVGVNESSATSGSNVRTKACNGPQAQRLRWVHETWTTPNVSWSLVKCSEGSLTQEITNIHHPSLITEMMLVEIAAAIEENVEFDGNPVSSTVSTLLSKQWELSQAQLGKKTYTCENYDNGESFAGGCLWQLDVTIKKSVKDKPRVLSWKPFIVKCSSGRHNEPPKCPPFTNCTDKACSKCEVPTTADLGTGKTVNSSKNHTHSGTEKNNCSESSGGTEAVYGKIFGALVSGIIFGIALSYATVCLRRRFKSSKHSSQNSNVQTIYQDLDLSKMKTDENQYQSLRPNVHHYEYANVPERTKKK